MPLGLLLGKMAGGIGLAQLLRLEMVIVAWRVLNIGKEILQLVLLEFQQ